MSFIYYTPSYHRIQSKYWNINQLPIGCGYRHLLRTTNPGMITIAQEPLIFRRKDLTFLAVTCANILTSTRSTMGHPFGFDAEWKTLLPLNFSKEK